MESYIFVNRFLRFSIFLCHYFTWLFSSSLPLFCHQYHHHCNRSHCCRWMLWFSCVWYNGAVWKNDSPYYIASLEKCKHEKTGGERWRDRESQKRRSETENYRYRRHIELTANFNYRKSTNTAIQDCNYILKSSVCGSHVWILRLINKISLLRSRSLSLSAQFSFTIPMQYMRTVLCTVIVQLQIQWILDILMCVDMLRTLNVCIHITRIDR